MGVTLKDPAFAFASAIFCAQKTKRSMLFFAERVGVPQNQSVLKSFFGELGASKTKWYRLRSGRGDDALYELTDQGKLEIENAMKVDEVCRIPYSCSLRWIPWSD